MSGKGHALSVGDTDDSGRVWRKSSRSYGGGNCVEVAVLRDERICVRDSKDRSGAILRFTPMEWHAFLNRIRK